MTAASARRIGFLLFEGFHSLDFSGPLEVLHAASQFATDKHRGLGYQLQLFARQPGIVRSFSGVGIEVTNGFDSEGPELDTLLIVGGPGVVFAARDEETVAFVEREALRARRVVSVCTGAFLLAAAGILDRRTATTHWAHLDDLAHVVPTATVDRDCIYVREGSVSTSAGITTGLDLALALVEEDLGADIALDVARYFVMPIRRSGGQPQRSAHLDAQVSSRTPIQRVAIHVFDSISGDLSCEQLAKIAGMSTRNFARVFARELGVTPASFVERARVETARRLLEESSKSTEEVARATGFGGPETMRRAFLRVLGKTPTDYRARTALRGSIDRSA